MGEQIQQLDDLSLLQAYRAGDAGAMETLYLRYRDRLYAYLVALLGSADEAEDALQDAWRKIVVPENTANVAQFDSFVFRCVRNCALDAIAHRNRRQKLLNRAEFIRRDGPGDPGYAVNAAELHEALRALPREQLEAIVLKIWSNLTFETLAEITGVPAGTAMTRYRLGIAKLREALDSEHG